MHLITPQPRKKARIEIIPLIDIMFFLLAVMMLVSLGSVRLKGLPVNLPSAASASADTRADFVTLSIKADGSLHLDGIPFASGTALAAELSSRKTAEPGLRLYIQGDAAASHGDVIAALDLAHAAGIRKVAFQTQARALPGPEPVRP